MYNFSIIWERLQPPKKRNNSKTEATTNGSLPSDPKKPKLDSGTVLVPDPDLGKMKNDPDPEMINPDHKEELDPVAPTVDPAKDPDPEHNVQDDSDTGTQTATNDPDQGSNPDPDNDHDHTVQTDDPEHAVLPEDQSGASQGAKMDPETPTRKSLRQKPGRMSSLIEYFNKCSNKPVTTSSGAPPTLPGTSWRASPSTPPASRRTASGSSLISPKKKQGLKQSFKKPKPYKSKKLTEVSSGQMKITHFIKKKTNQGDPIPDVFKDVFDPGGS